MRMGKIQFFGSWLMYHGANSPVSEDGILFYGI